MAKSIYGELCQHLGDPFGLLESCKAETIYNYCS